MEMAQTPVHVSLVSHGHGFLLLDALRGLALSLNGRDAAACVWLTFNTPEVEWERRISQTHWPFDVRIIKNPIPLGFGANHNQAFTHAQALGIVDWLDRKSVV